MDDDPQVSCFAQGFIAMVDDACAGIAPVMPGIELVPAALPKILLLELIKESQEQVCVKVVEHFDRSGGSLPHLNALGEVLTKCRVTGAGRTARART